jgi:phosphoglycerate dehydrogenase-like enzyme
MAMTILNVWCNARQGDAEVALLRESLAPHQLLLADGADMARLEHADVAFGQPDADVCAARPRLRWVHLSTAGYTTFDRPAIRAALAGRATPLTTSSSVYSEPCAQHLLAFMLGHARQLGHSARHQLTDHAWAKDVARSTATLLGGQTVLLVGFGAIARRLAELLAPFDLELIGVRRDPRGDEPVPTVALDALDSVLGRAHHIIDVLPGNAETAHFFDRRRLFALQPGAVFYNIGRGTTVDQAALLEALGSGRLGGAYLDVTDPEPLPPDHPLWTAPRCTITPHAAGGHANERERIARHFLANFRRHLAGEPLLDRVV